MKNAIIKNFESRVYKDKTKKLPRFRPGDTVRVHYRIQEGADKSKFRVQAYEGVVIRMRRGTADASFMVRKMAVGGVGVERVFPLNSPYIDKLEIVAKGAVRRSRLYYLRALTGKAARIKSRFHGAGEVDSYHDMITAETVLPEEAPKPEAKGEEAAKGKVEAPEAKAESQPAEPQQADAKADASPEEPKGD